MTSPVKDMLSACADVLAFASEIPGATALPAPPALHERIAVLFREMSAKAESMKIPAEDAAEARYALAAFIDEQLSRLAWPGRDQWIVQPLQFVYFNENTAGEGFFDRLHALEGQPQRAHVVAVYFACLSLGFQGRFAVTRGAGLDELMAGVKTRLDAALPPPAALSPRGSPPAEHKPHARRVIPILLASAIALGLALVVVIGLKLHLWSRVSAATSEIDKNAPAQTR